MLKPLSVGGPLSTHCGRCMPLGSAVFGRVRREIFSACQIERRPRGASRAALAPTFVSGQLFLWDLRANALVHGSISRRTNKAVAHACHRHYWPETSVGERSSRCAARAALDLIGEDDVTVNVRNGSIAAVRKFRRCTCPCDAPAQSLGDQSAGQVVRRNGIDKAGRGYVACQRGRQVLEGVGGILPRERPYRKAWCSHLCGSGFTREHRRSRCHIINKTLRILAVWHDGGLLHACCQKRVGY